MHAHLAGASWWGLPLLLSPLLLGYLPVLPFAQALVDETDNHRQNLHNPGSGWPHRTSI